MKQIRDPLTEKNVFVSDPFLEILDSNPVQRLRRISQLGLSSIVYPGCTHTRFVHTLGVFRNTKQYINSLNITDEKLTRRLKTAALLHDTGHGPNSHAIEALDSVPHHEDKSCQVVQKLANEGIINQSDVTAIQQLITGEHGLHVVTGDIDADRLDYLDRDAQNSGIPYGAVDRETIISSAEIEDGRLVYDTVAIEAIEGLLQSRKNMYGSVYGHPTVRSAEKMYIESIKKAPEISVQNIHSHTDGSLRQVLMNSDNTDAQNLFDRIIDREIHKTAFCLRRMDDVSVSDSEKQQFKQYLNSKIEPEEMELFIDWYPQREKTLSIPIKLEQSICSFDMVSDVDKSVHGGPYSVEMSVYCTEKYQDRVNNLSRKWFGIDRSGDTE